MVEAYALCVHMTLCQPGHHGLGTLQVKFTIFTFPMG